MQPLQVGYFGTHISLPYTRQFNAGKLTCHYENGTIRYIRAGSCEIIRLIYMAVRDSNWLTASYRIENEQIEETSTTFRVTYTSFHELADIRYRMDVRIEGRADNSITYHIQGEALSDFLRNRIGICVHHPIEHFSGKQVRITRPNGSWYQVKCPIGVNPHQPFLSVQSMEWSPMNDLNVRLKFEGEVFETEDQRNWTDSSFKTYSTPLILPYPAPVSKGDQLVQSVKLQVNPIFELDFPQKSIQIQVSDEKYPFPKIGYARSQQKLTFEEIALLKQVSFDHYRVELHFSGDWKAVLSDAISEARQLDTQLELICFFGQEAATETQELIDFLQTIPDWNASEAIASLLILESGQKTSPTKTLEQVIHVLKSFLPKEKLGAGTDGNFSELNRTREFSRDVGFLSYSVSPQVHLSDTRVLIENLEAQMHSVQTALTFSDTRALHVSPVTLKIRNYPEANTYNGSLPSNVDTRQYSTFTAAWTLVSLRYLAQAQRVTYFETVGMRGLMQGSEPPEDPAIFQTKPGDVFPVYDYLKQLKTLQPAFILHSLSSHPLEVDALLLASTEGKRTAFLVNFAEMEKEVLLLDSVIQLPPASITVVEL